MKSNEGFWNDFHHYAQDLMLEKEKGTDRGLVLVMCSMLDELLRRLLAAFLVDDDKTLKALFEGPNAPLGSFSARIKVAVALGLFSKREAECLDILREIRNDYAHRLAAEIANRPATNRNSMDARLRRLYAAAPWPYELTYDPSKPFRESFHDAAFASMTTIRDRFGVAFDHKRALRTDWA